MPEEPSGHVFRVERKRGPQWYAKFRLQDGRQVQRRIGPAWTERGRPPTGYFTKRKADAWLRDLLDQARRGTLPGRVRTGVSFAEAAEEFLRHIEHDRARKPSTVIGYRALVRSQLLPVFGDDPIESITTPMIESWLSGVDRSSSTRMKSLVLLHGIFRRARKLHGLRVNPAADVDFAGQVIRVRASYAEGQLTTPKSGKVRSVPMAPDVAMALAGLSERGVGSGDDDLVFAGPGGTFLDGRGLRRRYLTAIRRADLRRLRFHDLRHTFGTRMIGKADIRRVQEWMGHADVQTTMKYLHYVPREEDAALVAAAFAIEAPDGQAPTARSRSGA